MILCCGEALIDMIPEPCQSGATGFVPRSGGAIFNTALALGRLGCPVGLLSGVSTDLFGQQLVRDLSDSQVDTGMLMRSDRLTTLAFVHLQGGQASYSFMDENSAGRMVAQQDLPRDLSAVSALYFGGISLACTPGADTYAGFAQAHAAHKVVMLDPNIRPGFITDPAGYRQRLEGMLRLADLVKVSDEDLDWMFPGAAPQAQKIAQVQAMGPAVVLLTRGAQGVAVWTRDAPPLEVPAQAAKVVDTVGAGDTFNAGVLSSLWQAGVLTKDALPGLDPQQLTDAVAFGCQVAAVTVSRAGANPPWRAELGSEP